MNRLVAFGVLVFVQSWALLLFKLCQTKGAYTFNPASSVALTELAKLALALALHSRHAAQAKTPYFKNVDRKIVLNYAGLSLLYTINNQLSFYVLEQADPGSMSLGKSVAPYLCALLLRLNGSPINQLQWICIVVQCLAIAIVQYDVCASRGVLPLRAYGLIFAATAITAATSVWNQLVIKGFDVPVNCQNSIMYAFGAIIATTSYHIGRSGGSTTGASAIGFFEGYTVLPILLVLFQAFHGLAVSLVYKYADAIVKNFANSSVMAILFFVSYRYFHLKTNLHSWLGVGIVLIITYCYMNSTTTPAPSKEEAAGLLSSVEDGDAVVEGTPPACSMSSRGSETTRQ